MGDCIYCGLSAGFFRKKHTTCEQKNLEGIAILLRSIKEVFASRADINQLSETVNELRKTAFVSDEQIRMGASKGLAHCVDSTLSSRYLADDELAAWSEIINFFNLELSDVKESAQRLAKASILRAIELGALENVLRRDSDLPLRLKADEGVIWSFYGARLYSYRSKTEYIGGSQGFSVRIAKGISYRVGAHKGEAIKRDYLSEDAEGFLSVTNKGVYFISDRRSVSVPLKKILAVELFADALKITRDGVNARPLIFVVDDPSFAAMLVTQLTE